MKVKVGVIFVVLMLFASILMGADYSWKSSGKATLGVDGKSWKQIFLGGSSSAPIILEGATEDAYETSIVVTDPTADRTITIPNSSGTIALNPAGESMEFEGATANEFETTLAVADPTADRTVTLPDASGTTVLSTLATNAPDVANSIWGMTNGLAMGGATGGDGFELQLKPMGDPASDKYILFPVLTNAAAMISSLTTNDVNVANSVWGVSNGIAFGGATGADGFETTLTASDVTADKTVTLPNATGTVALTTGVGSYSSFTIATDNVTLTVADCGKIYGMATAAKKFSLPATAAGCIFTFINTGAATNNIVTVDPDAADQIFGNTKDDAGTKTTHIGDTGEAINNTAATSDRGDFIKLVGDGVDGWYIIGSEGIWAEDTP